MPGITAFIVFSCHKHLGNWEMKSSTIMVLQTNKQNSVLLINFTVLFLCRKGDICLKYEAAEMCGQCRNVY